MTPDELISNLKNLDPVSLARVFQELEDLKVKAAKHQAERHEAVLNLMENYPRCSCGRPAAYKAAFYLEQVSIKPYISSAEGRVRASVALSRSGWDGNYDLAPTILARLLGPEAAGNLIVYCDSAECRDGAAWWKSNLPSEEVDLTKVEPIDLDPSPMEMVNFMMKREG